MNIIKSDKPIDNYDRLQLIEAAVDGLPVNITQLGTDCRLIFDHMNGNMELNTHEMVGAKSTKDEVLSAVEHSYYVFSESSKLHLVPKREAAFKQLEKDLRVCETAVVMLSEMQGDTTEEKDKIADRLHATAMKYQRLNRLYIRRNDVLDRDMSRILQASLLDHVRKQPKEIKEWYMDEVMGKFAEHVTARIDPKTEVQVEEKTSTSFSLPPEIAALIYSACDLETCVVLRQVNSEWYNWFQQMGPLFKRKLHLRNPWFGPGDSLQTWGDCVLVFVARLKWPTTTDLDGIDVPAKKEDRKLVVASELAFNEKLPAEFSALQPHHTTCKQVACDHVHAMSRNLVHHIVRDLHTFETFSRDFESNIVRQEGDTTVLEFAGVEYTVAKDMVPTSGMPMDVWVTPRALVVESLPRGVSRLIMTRDKPHYEDGFVFDDNESDVDAIGDLLYAKKADVYHFIDHESKQVIKYPLETRATLSASYNGLVWWHVNETIMVPTFLDLETGQVHYNPEKTITGVSDDIFSQCSEAPEGRHFTFALLGGSNVEMVNLETGAITEVSYPKGMLNKRLAMIPGLMNGKFRAYCMDEKVHKKSHNAVMKAWNVPRGNW